MISSVRIKRKIPLWKMFAVTVSRFGYEFVIHVPDEYDYRFRSEDFRERILE
jgi:serum/glucocorticoid-regulated kinase 2